MIIASIIIVIVSIVAVSILFAKCDKSLERDIDMATTLIEYTEKLETVDSLEDAKKLHYEYFDKVVKIYDGV